MGCKREVEHQEDSGAGCTVIVDTARWGMAPFSVINFGMLGALYDAEL